MSSRHEVAPWVLAPKIINALEAVFGSKMEPIVPERSKIIISPWTITGKGVTLDFHLLPDRQTWLNVSLAGRSIMDIDLTPDAITVEPDELNPREVTIRGERGEEIIIPKDGKAIFKKL